MQTKELNEVFKASAEVTSLATTDRVLMCDSNGVPKRISKRDCFSYVDYALGCDINSGIWIRIGEMQMYTVGTLYINNKYYNVAPRALVMDIIGSHPVKPEFYNIIVRQASPYYTKARFTKAPGNMSYLELFVKTLKAQDTLFFYFSDMVSFTLMKSPTIVTSDVEVIKEFDLTAATAATIVGGG